MRKEIGKIRVARFGYGGYQDACLGFTFDMGSRGWGVGDFKGMWAERTEGCKWTEEDQAREWARANKFVKKLMNDAEVTSLDKLIGKPVEVTFDGTNTLVSWRILKEVL